MRILFLSLIALFTLAACSANTVFEGTAEVLEPSATIEPTAPDATQAPPEQALVQDSKPRFIYSWASW